jgi:mitogen-activated protein kinase kinase
LLKLSIPLDGGGGGAAFSNNSDDGSNLRTPMPGEEDRDVTVHARTYHLQRDEDFGAADKMAKLTEEVRNAMSRMRPFDASPDPSTGGRSRSGSATGSASGASGAPPGSGDDLTKLRAVNLSRISDGDDSRPSSVHSGPEHFDERTHFTVLRRLGEGTGGAVDLVTTSTGQVMARKVIARTANPAIHKQTLRELEFLSSTSSPYIVNHYGAFLAEHDQQICIIMEYCEAGSLDSLLDRMKETGLLCTEPVLGRIAASVLRGLNYLHELQIIHRDIKPSNILVTRQGAVKLCDFGVSGELVGSFAQTFTGTSYYMAPERILHKPYTIKADVWSLGLTLHEVANLRFPFPPEGENQAVAPIELLSYIVTAPVPALQDNPAIGRIWSQDIRRFMDRW